MTKADALKALGVKFFCEDIVYLRCDEENRKYIIIEIAFCGDNSIMYRISGTEGTKLCYACELSYQPQL